MKDKNRVGGLTLSESRLNISYSNQDSGSLIKEQTNRSNRTESSDIGSHKYSQLSLRAGKIQSRKYSLKTIRKKLSDHASMGVSFLNIKHVLFSYIS